MASFFNPGSALFRRGVVIASAFSCTAVGIQVILSDFGSQKHIFTPIQVYVNKKVDGFYNVTQDELYGAEKLVPDSGEKPFIRMERIDTKKAPK